MTTQIDLAVQILEADEGFECEPYYCSEKYPTFGHGFRIVGTKQHDPLPKNVRIGYDESLARLRALCVTNERTFLSNPDLKTAYENCSALRKAVLLSMAHQLGIYGVLKFKKLLCALARSDFKRAAAEALDSRAYRQTPNRWARNAAMLESGELHNYYI